MVPVLPENRKRTLSGKSTSHWPSLLKVSCVFQAPSETCWYSSSRSPPWWSSIWMIWTPPRGEKGSPSALAAASTFFMRVNYSTEDQSILRVGFPKPLLLINHLSSFDPENLLH